MVMVFIPLRPHPPLNLGDTPKLLIAQVLVPVNFEENMLQIKDDVDLQYYWQCFH